MSQSKSFEFLDVSVKDPLPPKDSDSDIAPLFISNPYGNTFIGYEVSRGLVLMGLRQAVYEGLSKIPFELYGTRALQLLNCTADDLTRPASSPCGPIAATVSRLGHT